MSVKHRFAITVFVLVAILISAILWITQSRFVEISGDRAKVVDGITISLLMHPAVEALITQNYGPLQADLAHITQNPRITDIAVFDGQGRIVAALNRELIGTSGPVNSGTGSDLWVRHDIVGSSGVLGQVAVSLSDEDLIATSREIRNLGLGIAALGLSVLACMALLCGAVLTRRLVRVTNAAEQVASGNLEVRLGRDHVRDEVGQLGCAFDNMVDRLRQNVNDRLETESALQRSHDELSVLVGERSLANLSLRCEIERRKRTEARFRSFVESAPDATIIINDTGVIEFINKQTEALFGYQRKELLGETIELLIPERFRQDHPCHRNSFFKKPVRQTMCSSQELFGRSKDGREFPVEISLNAVGHSEKLLASAVIRDVTDRKAIEVERRQLELELAHVARINTLGLMATGIAHEVNQPLTVIAANIDTVLSATRAKLAMGPEIVGILHEIEEQAHQAGSIIRALRRFLRKDNSDKCAVDLNALIMQTIQIIQPEASASKILLVTVTKHISDPFADRVQITQVLVNLIRNSIQAIAAANSPARTVTLRTSSGGENVTVSVQDTGPGLSAAVNLFTPFESTKSDGMGMGLSISRSIIEAHGGQLWTDTEPGGQGVCFTFTLPVREA